MAAKSKGIQLGDYQLLEEIGKGEFSVVQKARAKVGNVVAIKRIISKEGSNKAQKALEATIKFPKHNNVVQLLDIYSHVDLSRCYLVYEYFESQDLNDYVIPRTVCNNEKMTIITEISKGLEFIHGKGMPHGDLRPQNVLVGWCRGKRVCKITDYGVAFVQKLGPKSKLRKMNEYYTDPETLRTGTVNRASDIFSLGQLTFVIIAEPIKSESGKKLLVPAMNVGEEAYTLSRLSQEGVLYKIISKDLGEMELLTQVIVLMLMVDPKERPSIDLVVEQLEEAQRARIASGLAPPPNKDF